MKRYINFKTFAVFITVLLLFLLIINPRIAIDSVLDGIKLWYYNVMPSLFPFMIFSSILFQLNATYFLQKLFNKPTNKIFNVSGSGILPIVMGYISGYPLGGKLVCDLRKNKLISLKESYKLIAMCSTTGPAFLIGIVSVQMFDNTAIIPVLLLSNYLGGVLNALLIKPLYRETIVTNTYKKFEDKSFSHILNDSIVDSIQSVLKICGYMVFFNLLICYLDSIHAVEFLTNLFSKYLNFFNLSSQLTKGLLYGIFEITLGINVVSQCSDPMLVKVAVTAFIIAWSGLSIHMQTNSFLVETDIKYSRFFLFKISQSFISLIISIISFVFLYPKVLDVYNAFGAGNYLKLFDFKGFYYATLEIMAAFAVLLIFLNKSSRKTS